MKGSRLTRSATVGTAASRWGRGTEFSCHSQFMVKSRSIDFWRPNRNGRRRRLKPGSPRLQDVPENGGGNEEVAMRLNREGRKTPGADTARVVDGASVLVDRSDKGTITASATNGSKKASAGGRGAGSDSRSKAEQSRSTAIVRVSDASLARERMERQLVEHEHRHAPVQGERGRRGGNPTDIYEEDPWADPDNNLDEENTERRVLAAARAKRPRFDLREPVGNKEYDRQKAEMIAAVHRLAVSQREEDLLEEMFDEGPDESAAFHGHYDHRLLRGRTHDEPNDDDVVVLPLLPPATRR
jgi:hypothetical protein